MSHHNSPPLPPEYQNLTLGELLTLYDGTGAVPCPPALEPWLASARSARNIAAQVRSNDQLEVEIKSIAREGARLDRVRGRGLN